MTEEHCVCCGAIIPEGTQVCSNCSRPEPEVVSVEPEGSCYSWWHVCERCHTAVDTKDKVCPGCKKKLRWD